MRSLAFACLVAAACGQVRFGPPPTIESFTADAAEVGSGEPVTLRWRASRATSYELSGVGRVGDQGAVVMPATDAGFVLTASGLGGSVRSEPLQIRVHASLALAVGTDDARGTGLLVRLRTARGEPPSSDVLVRVELPSHEVLDIPCPAGRRACPARSRETAILDAEYRASAILDGVALSASAFPDDVAIEKPRNVRASLRDGAVRVTWDPAQGARGYRTQLLDLDTQELAGFAVESEGTSASLDPGTWSLDRVAVAVEAWTAVEPRQAALGISRGVGFVSAGPQGGTGASWQLFSPQDFTAGELRVGFPSLSAGDRLAVIAVNAGGPDGARFAARSSGIGNPDPGPPGTTALSVGFSAPVATPHDELRARQDGALLAALGAGLPPPAGAAAVSALPASFCIARGLDFGNRVRKAVVRALETDHAAFFVDAQDVADIPPGFVERLGTLFEEHIYPADRVVFGEESDVDRNGKLFIVLSHELGAHLNGGWLLGYFGNDDLLRGRDDSA
ncbi:MAG TPA: hypothetical protein VIZ69_02095, partial [Thermoanaerobaculia bacterium]